MPATITANSAGGQLAQMAKGFEAVKNTARRAEAHQARSTEMLMEALGEVYEFVDSLLSLAAAPGVNMMREFYADQKIAYNSRAQVNPFIGLVKLAFPKRSDSSVSQYSTVLRYALSLQVKPRDFKAWIKAGIEHRRDQALEHFGSTQRANSDAARTVRLKRAETVLLGKPASNAVQLPQGIQANEGFALVLARIDGANNASIIDVINAQPESLAPTLLRYDDTKRIKDKGPLAGFYRAVQLIVGTTSDQGSNKRDILIVNTIVDGSEVCNLRSISKAYSFPGATVSVLGFVGDIPADQPFVLSSADADLLSKQYGKHDNWSLSDQGILTADKLAQPISLLQLATGYRYAPHPRDPNKAISIEADEQAALLTYLEAQRADLKRKNKDRKQPESFATSMDVEVHNDRLMVKLPKAGLACQLGTTGPDRQLDGRLLVADVESVMQAFQPYETTLTGWFVDQGVEDAALVLDGYVDDDHYQLTIPTRVGTTYNQVCEDVV